jgi:hypothetical protein
MDEKWSPKRKGLFDRFFDSDRGRPLRSITPWRAIPQKRVPVYQPQQACPEVKPRDSPRAGDRAGLGIDVIPRAIDLRLQPSAQGAEMFLGLSINAMRTPHPFTPGQKVKIEHSATLSFFGAVVSALPFGDDLVHIWTHRISFSGWISGDDT